MMHKCWSGREEAPYGFLRWFIKFQGQTGNKKYDFDLNWVFPDCNNSVNSQMVIKWCSVIEYLLYCFLRSFIKFDTHTYSISQEICTRFLLCCALLWLYIDWFSHVHQAYIKFQDYRGPKSSDFAALWAFLDNNIHGWLWNNTHSF